MNTQTGSLDRVADKDIDSVGAERLREAREDLFRMERGLPLEDEGPMKTYRGLLYGVPIAMGLWAAVVGLPLVIYSILN